MPIKDLNKRRENQRDWRRRNPTKVYLSAKKYAQKNKEKINKKSSEWRKNNPEKSLEIQRKYRKKNREKYKLYEKVRNLKRNYNMSLEEFNILKQDNHCRICRNEFTEIGFTSAVVDHSHITGKVRSLLCGSCNSLLGYAKDSVLVLHNAIEYLEYFEKHPRS